MRALDFGSITQSYDLLFCFSLSVVLCGRIVLLYCLRIGIWKRMDAHQIRVDLILVSPVAV
jgi:hypothetical protein